MKRKIINLIQEYIRDYAEQTKTNWKKPIVSFADSNDPLFLKLKEIISSTHALPSDFLPEAKTVISYFIPFAEDIVNSNIKEKAASKQWAQAYIETNQLIADLNQYIQKNLRKNNYKASLIPATHNFDEEKLISDWSHRHVAYIAGLGTFGVNNMLITKKGCCGRVGTIVTDLSLKPTPRPEDEYCLYKQNRGCLACVSRCVNEALYADDFKRDKCYEMCLYNDKLFEEMKTTDVCGKCLVDVPCSYKIPGE